jgi:hypothetical protein
MKHPRQRTYPTWLTLLGPRGLLSVKGLLCVVYGVGTYSQILVRQLSILLACLEQDWSSGYEIKKDA